MPTLKAYENGLSVGCAGSGGKRETKRGRNGGWTPGATRRNRQFLQSIDCDALDGDGYAFTLTVRDIPASAEDYAAAVDLLMRRLRRAGVTRWHRVIELTKRRRPHLHGSIYFPQGWTPPGSPITDSGAASAVGWWVVEQWRQVAIEYEAGLRGQQVTPITGPVGWLKYLSKHAARGVRHYQRQGKPAGWDRTGRLWGRGGKWPVVEPLRLQLTTDQAWRLRRLVKRYAIADARAKALGHERSGRTGKAAAEWDRLSFLRGMLKSSERLGACRGISEWASQEVTLRLALAAGWDAVMA